MNKKPLLIYGANGYTGQLILQEAISKGLLPVLAGRKEASIRPLAERHGLEYHLLSLEEKERLTDLLSGVLTVIHAAGPFQITARPMAEACIEAGTHYVDITGEIDVFELLKGYDQKAKDKGVMLLPGAGFDVVPTDCMALHLKNQLPDATHLSLAFASLGSAVSHGTATTMSLHLGEGGAVRRDGKIVAEPIGQNGRWIDFGVKRLFAMSIPWGDVSTSFTTTGIPNIQTYMAAGKDTYRLMKLQFLFNWLLRTSTIRALVKKQINRRPAGPSEMQRMKGKTLVWGEVVNASGEKKAARMQCPEGYALTAQTAVLIAQKILSGGFKAGYQTPAGCYGEHLITEVEGIVWEDVNSLI